jgi:hypothetical protein
MAIGQPSSWATPCSRDWKDTPGQATIRVNEDGTTRNRTDQLSRQVHGMNSESCNAPTVGRGVLAPEFARWLMGYPESWCTCSPKYKHWRQLQDAIEKDVSKDTENA